MKILLVLDDVNKHDQLDALCISRRWFGQGSIIIITTRDVDLLRRLQVDHEYTMNAMDATESLELFSWYAFQQPFPREGFAVHSTDVLNNSRRIPLLLEIIGSYLSTTRRITVWDGLREYDVRGKFFDIALNLSGKDQNDVIQILRNSGHSAEIGIRVLVQRRLVTVDSQNRIQMHGLVQDCGREIITDSSTVMPEVRYGFLGLYSIYR